MNYDQLWQFRSRSRKCYKPAAYWNPLLKRIPVEIDIIVIAPCSYNNMHCRAACARSLVHRQYSADSVTSCIGVDVGAGTRTRRTDVERCCTPPVGCLHPASKGVLSSRAVDNDIVHSSDWLDLVAVDVACICSQTSCPSIAAEALTSGAVTGRIEFWIRLVYNGLNMASNDLRAINV